MRHYAARKQLHVSTHLRGTACYNCINMCVTKHGRKIPVEEYWCDRQHGFIEPPESCEKRRDA